MSVTESKGGSTIDIDLRPLAAAGVPECTWQTEIARIDPPDLRTITPEEIQILAAAGC